MRFNIFNRPKKIAVITGATGGVGRALVQCLLKQNYRIVMIARNLAQLEQISLHFGKHVTGCVCDISQATEVHYLCHDIQSRFGQIDVLVHSAGNIYPGSLFNQNDKTIQDQIQVNLTGAIYITKGLLPLIKRKGSIIFINSLSGLFPLKNSAVYSASKFGLRGFALALALELRKKNIYVSSIHPAAINTKMLRQEVKDGGSLLNFCTPPLSTDIICQTVLKAIRQKKLEYFIPKWLGFQIKLIMLKPFLLHLLMPYMEKKGKKGKEAWQQQFPSDFNDS